MGFQNGAFQTPIAFQSHTGIPGEGWTKKFDSEAYAYAYNHADSLRRRIKQLPNEVQEVIADAVEIPKEQERTAIARQKLGSIELKFQRLYLALLEQYCECLLDEQLKLQLQLAEKRRMIADDEAAILILLLT